MNLKKLRTMSLEEVSHRLKVIGSKKLLKLLSDKNRDLMAAYRLLPDLALPSDYDGPFADATAHERWEAAENYLLEHMRARVSGHGYHDRIPGFFFTRGQRAQSLEVLERPLKEVVSETLSQAEKILQHRFSYLGVEARFEQEIDWHRDPLSCRRWPQKFYTDMKFYGQGDDGENFPGDVKHVWELNRHQHFIVLGKAFWLTRDEKYAVEVFAQMQGWMQQNPFLWGINWTSALEAGMRCLSWIWAYHLCLDAGALNAGINAKVLRMLHLHGHYLNRHLSFFTSPYNHLVGEATALFFLGVLFPEFAESAAWRRKGWDILATEITRQFHADGMSVEQAVSYHHFTLGLYLQAVILAQRNGIKVPQPMLARLERAVEFSCLSMQPDGLHPMIGDCDDARAIYFGERTAWDFRDVPALGAVLFGRGDFKRAAGDFQEACLWLLGPESFSKYQALPPSEPAALNRLLPESGYAIFRNGWAREDHYMIFDCGPHSHGLHADENVSTAHGHADYLSFVLHVHGLPLLVDSGMLTYNGDLAWQNYFRSGMAHNTITIDGESACRLAGRLGYAHVPTVERSFESFQDDFAFVEAGYRGFGGKVWHRRGIFYRVGDYWLVLDALEGEGEHVIDRWFHFAPETPLADGRGQIFTERRDARNLLVRDFSTRRADLEISNGGAGPEQGWIAPAYATKIAAPVARLRSRERLPVQLCTLIMPIGHQVPDLDCVCSDEHGPQSTKAFCMRLGAGRWKDELVFNFSGHKQIIDNLRTDAKIVYLRRDAVTNIMTATMVQGTHLSVKDEKIFEFQKTTDARHALIDFI